MNGQPQHPELTKFRELLQAQFHEQEVRFTILLEEIFHQARQASTADEEEGQLLKPGGLLSMIGCEQNGCNDGHNDLRESPPAGQPTSQIMPVTPHETPFKHSSKTVGFFARHAPGRIWRDFGKEQIVDDSYCLPALVLSKTFLNTSTLVVVLNAAYLGYISEYALAHLDEPRNLFIDCMDVFFLAFYVIELLLKLIVFGTRFFYNHEWQWNCFDTFLVGLGINEEISKFLATKSDGGGLAGIVRVLRILKTVKMLRIIRVMRFFRELRLFLMPIMQSMRALFWTLFMLSLIMYIFGIIILQGVVNAKLSNDVAGKQGDDLQEHFGSVLRCMISLFYSVTGGNDWGVYADMMKHLGAHYVLFFFFYIAFLTFAVLNILTGIFVDSAMQFSQDDRNESREGVLRDAVLRREVLKYLEICDDDASGSLDRSEFERHLHSEEMQDFLCRMEMNLEDATLIFDRLSKEGTGQGVFLEAFLDCAINLRGQARNLHLHELMADVASLGKEVKNLCLSQVKMTSDLKTCTRIVSSVASSAASNSKQRGAEQGLDGSASAPAQRQACRGREGTSMAL